MAVVAVPFILYLVRFCSPKPCNKIRKLFCDLQRSVIRLLLTSTRTGTVGYIKPP